MSEGTYTYYDILGYLFEDLIREGSRAACISEVLTAVVNDLGVDATTHRTEDHSVFTRDSRSVKRAAFVAAACACPDAAGLGGRRDTRGLCRFSRVRRHPVLFSSGGVHTTNGDAACLANPFRLTRRRQRQRLPGAPRACPVQGMKRSFRRWRVPGALRLCVSPLQQFLVDAGNGDSRATHWWTAGPPARAANAGST